MGAEVELKEKPGWRCNVGSVDTGGSVIARVEVGVIGLVNLGEVVDDRLPVVLVAAWAWWLEVGVTQGGGRGKGVVLFARGEKVEVAGEDEEAVRGIRIHMSGVVQDGMLNCEYLRGREPVIMNVPMDPAEPLITRGDT